MAGLAKSVRLPLLARLARGGFRGGQALEIIQPAGISGGAAIAAIPAFGPVGSLVRGVIARFVAALPVAPPHLGRVAGPAIASPARKTPVVGTCLSSHRPCCLAVRRRSRNAKKMPEGL